jgi:hypothetical protein
MAFDSTLPSPQNPHLERLGIVLRPDSTAQSHERGLDRVRLKGRSCWELKVREEVKFDYESMKATLQGITRGTVTTTQKSNAAS